MYFTTETLETDLKAAGYVKLERKPWNVREDDVIVLEQYGMGFMNSGFIPVIVTILDSYPEYHRSDVTPTKYTKVSRKTFKFWHKALHATDSYRITGWQSTRWNSYDDVEIWRKK